MVVVIGAGAAGLMAGGNAASLGKEVMLIEKNKLIGRKLLITGKGRCNVTNIASMEEVMDNIPTNNRFLYSAFNKFSNYDLMNFFEDLSVKLKVERGGRVFPESDKAVDIVDALRRYISNNGVKLINGTVERIIQKDGNVAGVELNDKRIINCDSVIIATGGLSYPATGSSGDGYRMALALGHTIIPPKPALVPIEIKEEWVKHLQGLSLKNVTLTLFDGNDVVFSEMGEMLFTHFGVSGPLVLSVSSHMKQIESRNYRLSIDLKPALDLQTLEARVIKDFNDAINKDYINSLSALLPVKLIPVIASLSKIDERKKIHQITKEERKYLCELLKNLELTPSGFRPIEEAIITSGGINVKEINPSTMESKIVKGLYFAGEVMDVDAYTGGFNLQIAFSTGFLSGLSC